jgi:RluA family pseudouridine synthase
MTKATSEIKNIAAYKFVDLDRLPQRRKELASLCKELGLKGTILLSPEGINLFLAGLPAPIDSLLGHLRQDRLLADLDAKVSFSDRIPFRRLLVKIKREIIAFGVEAIRPAAATAPKLPARTLKAWLDANQPVTLLDVRNDYEFALGAFQQAIRIGVDNFRQFPTQVAALPEELRQRPLVMYCTGGIRCEKAGPLLQQAGFREVYQLDGGILKYFEECGGAHYRGECFVFDQRVALDSQLRETPTALCFACQAPLSVEDQASPRYVVGKSCPRCYQTPTQTMQRTLERRRSRWIELTDPLPGSQPYENRRPITVPHSCHGATLWELLTTVHPHVAVQQWREAIAAGRLQRDRQPLQADDRVQAGQRIENVIPQTTEPDVNVAIEFLYEDAMIVVVNKPAPLPMHPCGRFNRNTLIDLLNQVYRPERLRVAHRLDANTTGVVVLSRTRSIAGQLQPQFERGEVQKRYLAKVQGHPPHDTFACEAAIDPVAGRAGCREVSDTGLASRTEFLVRQRYPDGTTLLEAVPITGRTNQIRLHLAHLGFPVVGDPMYGVEDADNRLQTLRLTDPPLCLHAWQLAFRHPLDGQTMTFTAPPPNYL